MKKKLELKHLAPYLPYGLKVYHERHIARIVSYYMPAGNYKRDCWIVSVEDTIDHELSCSVHFSEIEPILRPLSDLTKEIEVNEEKFVPLGRLSDRIDTDLDFEVADSYYLDLNYVLSDYQKLLEWHFDVFELIEKGLAIDINTLD